MSREFEAFCIDHGIQRQHSARNRPQQNGVAERANRTLEEGIISMLYESGMPLSFWGEVWDPLSMYTTEHSHPLCRTVHLMKHSMGANQTSLCCTFGAVLLMSWFRRIRDLLGV